ncbi:hypothetical protein [Streptomyces lavendulocolor]|uniref:hypothetical protein n=1 Tax=Streptomyces lavendulocolor TaxID=67316 RepID=UPI0033F0A2F4
MSLEAAVRAPDHDRDAVDTGWDQAGGTLVRVDTDHRGAILCAQADRVHAFEPEKLPLMAPF